MLQRRIQEMTKTLVYNDIGVLGSLTLSASEGIKFLLGSFFYA
ncbi:hypothetical protein Bcop_2333 [Bacteroides coprosuis DSM 18011]|uniref:Uncharacterized protein n=1 Tax=Bacteroides coprosuis DSM 18011 TaxID=679937 RepID=F3ZV32_9BACE|nr:hypothetical protein Bcop_2333 [Bacteroides coprosuis DSM 18011]